MNAITIILSVLLIGCMNFIGGLIIYFVYSYYHEKKAKKEFDKRQEKYKRMI